MLYDIVVLGEPNTLVLAELKKAINHSVKELPIDIDCLQWHKSMADFSCSYERQSCILFFGSNDYQQHDIAFNSNAKTPIIPIVTDIKKVSEQIPECLQKLNCVELKNNETGLLATTILASFGLLPEQRRIFISYRRKESTQVALQLYEQLSSHRFNVFLDTHKILPAKDFQNELLHSLSDSDVLLMLDTPEYFSSHWTTVEFGKAKAKNITILRLGWPKVKRSSETLSIIDNMDLSAHCFTKAKRLRKPKLSQVVKMIEQGRSKGMALRQKINLGKICGEIERADGMFIGVGQRLEINATLAKGTDVLLRPILAVPSAYDLQRADEENHSNKQVAMLYDSLDLKGECIAHIDWLGKNVRHIPWLTMQNLDKQLLGLEC